MNKDLIKKGFIIFSGGIAVGMILSGCASTDPARYIQRNCPVKRVYGDEAMRVSRERLHYDGKYAYMTDSCLFNSISYARFCDSEGIEYTEDRVMVKYGKRLIPNGHVRLVVNGSIIEYRDGLGTVRIKK